MPKRRYYRRVRGLKQYSWVFFLILIVLLAAIFFSTHIASSKKEQILPSSILKKIAFQVYVPPQGDTWSLDSDSVKYNNEEGILTYTMLSGGISAYITEQNTPDQFNDIPQYYPALLGKLNQYSQIETKIGTVALTSPTELKGGQTAVLNSHGTLMFIKPTKKLSDNEWKQLINSFEVIK